MGMLFLLAATVGATAPTKVGFPAEDGITISADLYVFHADPKTPFIVLFHQAGWSRGEYREIAPRLGGLGFNCLAVDQRSGKAVGGVDNETHARAVKAKRSTTYVDALGDMRAALRYARARHAKGRLLAWGSSYSAALVLVLAGEQPELLDAALAFAPGEYFAKLGKGAHWVREAAARIKAPVFITSARAEAGGWKAIFAAIPAPARTSYIPTGPGQHGSRALWSEFADAPGYWRAVESFLRSQAVTAPGVPTALEVVDPCAEYYAQPRLSPEEHERQYGCPPCPCACLNGEITCAPCAACPGFGEARRDLEPSRP